MYDVIIIGAGPSGMTSALYALRANKKVLLLEENTYGGQIINAYKIENYPAIMEISGYDYATNLYNQIIKLKAEIKYEKVLKITKDKTITTNKNTYQAKNIIIATGTKNRKLNLDEEKLIGKGVSYCATCDGNFYKNKVVAVVGGGNTALEDCLYLSNLAKKVYLIHRRDKFRSEAKYIDEVSKKENVEIILNSNIVKINGEEKLENITLSNGQNIVLDGLFIAIGRDPNSEIFKDILKTNESGYIITDGVTTNIPGIYVVGDVREKSLRQLTTAVSDGSVAASKIF